MKYAIDKQFGIWRYARQPVMGKWFFNLAEKMLNTEKYYRAIKNIQVTNFSKSENIVEIKGYMIRYKIKPCTFYFETFYFT